MFKILGCNKGLHNIGSNNLKSLDVKFNAFSSRKKSDNGSKIDTQITDIPTSPIDCNFEKTPLRFNFEKTSDKFRKSANYFGRKKLNTESFSGYDASKKQISDIMLIDDQTNNIKKLFDKKNKLKIDTEFTNYNTPNEVNKIYSHYAQTHRTVPSQPEMRNLMTDQDFRLDKVYNFKIKRKKSPTKQLNIFKMNRSNESIQKSHSSKLCSTRSLVADKSYINSENQIDDNPRFIKFGNKLQENISKKLSLNYVNKASGFKQAFNNEGTLKNKKNIQISHSSRDSFAENLITPRDTNGQNKAVNNSSRSLNKGNSLYNISQKNNAKKISGFAKNLYPVTIDKLQSRFSIKSTRKTINEHEDDPRMILRNQTTKKLMDLQTNNYYQINLRKISTKKSVEIDQSTLTEPAKVLKGDSPPSKLLGHHGLNLNKEKKCRNYPKNFLKIYLNFLFIFIEFCFHVKIFSKHYFRNFFWNKNISDIATISNEEVIVISTVKKKQALYCQLEMLYMSLKN